MQTWNTPLKPTEIAENRLVSAILDGTFPKNSLLPPERDLAAMLGVTRPTLREALQRLSRDGWLEIHQGKLTRVKDYLREGNLQVLNKLGSHPESLPEGFVPNLLSFRVIVAPEMSYLAISKNPEATIALLKPLQAVEEKAAIFAEADFELQFQLSILSGNPVFTLMYNSFRELYLIMGTRYFLYPQARVHSQRYYQDLLALAARGDADNARLLTTHIMQDSLNYWNNISQIIQEG